MERVSGRRSPLSPYSAQYETVVGHGHTRPTAMFSAPTLVWHVGVWPRRKVLINGALEDCDPHDVERGRDGRAVGYKKMREEFARRRRAWLAGIDDTLCKLEKKRLRRDPNGSDARPKRFLIAPSGAHEAPLVDSGAVGMELWWDDTEQPGSNDATRRANAIRVRLQVDLTPDYVTYCFCMDLAHTFDGGAPAGTRRVQLLKAVETIQNISGVNREVALDALTPPEDLFDEEHGDLLSARNLLYVGAWEEFARYAEVDLSQLAGQRGEVFANFRGLVMPAAKLTPNAWPGVLPDTPFAKFSNDPKFDADGPEANAVVKAYWPFVRRITPAADYREFIACGVLNWRALYITALGASSQRDPGEDRPSGAISDIGEPDIGVRQAEVRGAEDTTPADDQCVWPREGGDGTRNNHPVRYLLLTKGLPNPRQIGRIVERINAMGTMRLFALKDLRSIDDADSAIRMLGQELDSITGEWSAKRNRAEELRTFALLDYGRDLPQYREIGEELAKVPVPGAAARTVRRLVGVLAFVLLAGGTRQVPKEEQDNKVRDAKYALLHGISTNIEQRLIGLGANIDALGERAIGGLHFRINRSRHYAREFRVLLKTLNVGSIPTWVSYEQFVARGLQPSFQRIAETGARLRALRARLGTVTEMIETSALVGQTEATRHNTAVLRSATTIVLSALGIALLHLTLPDASKAITTWLRARFAWLDSIVSKSITQLLDEYGYAVFLGALAAFTAWRVLLWLFRKLRVWQLRQRYAREQAMAGR